jgi:hypothetical protein
MDNGIEDCRKSEELVRLIRRVARDLFFELIDEHLDDYEHKEKPAREEE